MSQIAAARDNATLRPPVKDVDIPGPASRNLLLMPFRITLLVAALVAAAGCSSNAERIDRQARAAGLSRTVVTGSSYRHVVYGNRVAARPGTWTDRFVVFLDGDGRPWSEDGQQPSTDPTTRNPIALKLLARTPVPAIYVSRPCYQQLEDGNCSAETWTSGRYSPAVVESIATAIRNAAEAAGLHHIVLIGYSGGGALAVLVAEHSQNVAAVVTLAANLDTDAWTRHHGYLPLIESLNPATGSGEHSWPEIHLQGALDTIVPVATTQAYFERYPAAQRWTFGGYDHLCCWIDGWPAAFAKIQEQLER